MRKDLVNPKEAMEHIRYRTLERVHFQMRQYFHDAVFQSIKMDALVDHLAAHYADEWVLELRAKILSEKIADVTSEWPEDWWQAFKARWFPEWAKRRWPVRIKRETLTARLLWPHMEVQENYQHFVIPQLIAEATVVEVPPKEDR